MNETLLMVFIGVTAVAVVLQMLILAGMYASSRKMSARVTALSAKVEEEVLPLAAKVRVMVDENSPMVHTVLTNLAETSELVREQAGQIDRAVTEVVGMARAQAAKADELASRTLGRVDATAQTLQHAVNTPVRRVSALMEGVVAGIGEYVGGRKVRRARVTPTDQMFI